jgi:hypothetical protein
MPGSSGSAVFNDRGEIAGLVFAGRGELGYAFSVPQAFIYSFVNDEASTLPYLAPGPTPSSIVLNKERVHAVCNTNSSDERIDRICKLLKTVTPYEQ